MFGGSLSSRRREAAKGAWRLPLATLLSLGLSTAPALAKTTVIQFWFPTWNPAVQAWLRDEAIPQFQKENPGLQVEPTYLTWNDYEQKLMVGFAGGVFPDVLVIPSEAPRRYAKLGMVLPLDRYVQAWGQQRDYVPPAWETASIDGHQYGIPWSVQGPTLVFRRSAMAEVGLPAAIPETWAAFKEAAVRLTRYDGNKLVRLGYSMPGDQPLMNWIQAAGAELFTPDMQRVAIASPEAEQALAFLVDVNQAMRRPGAEQGPLDFTQGTVVMAEREPTYLGGLQSTSPEVLPDIGVGVTPRGARHVVRVYVPNLAIGRRSQDPDAAWKWIAFLQRPENLARYNATFGRLSPRRSQLAGDFIRTIPQFREFLDLYTRYGVPNVWPPVGFPELRKPVQALLPKLWAQQISPRAFLEEVARAWQALLAEQR